MHDFLLTDEQRALRAEIRDLVRWVPRDMVVRMDQDAIHFPREFLREAGQRNLLGIRYPREWGGRGLDWVATCMAMEEIGTLGYIFACTYGVGAELVCDAIIQHGTDLQKERYVRPLLRGDAFAAEALTEPGADRISSGSPRRRRTVATTSSSAGRSGSSSERRALTSSSSTRGPTPMPGRTRGSPR